MYPLQTVQKLLNLEPEKYSLEDLRVALQRASLRIDLLALTPIPSVEAGAVVYKTFVTDYQDWDVDAVFYDSSYLVLTPSEEAPDQGIWSFSVEPTRPVYISGVSVDVYAAAAQMLESLASNTGEDLSSYSGQNGAYAMVSKSGSYARLAQQYRNRQRLSSVVVMRGDLA